MIGYTNKKLTKDLTANNPGVLSLIDVNKIFAGKLKLEYEDSLKKTVDMQ